MVIYADVLLAVNWWIDFLLLVGVARVVGDGVRAWRLAVGGLVGALSCGVLFLPPLPALVSLAIKLATAAVTVAVTFGFGSWRQLGKRLLLFFGLSAGLAGLCSALYFFAAPQGLYVVNGVVYYAVSPWLLIGLTLVCYGILTIYERIKRRRAPLGRDFRLRLTVDGHSVCVRCLYDSGNHLVEPFSNRPVLVVARASLERLLPVPRDTAALPPNGFWRVVPFDSLGGEGLLPAFLPQQLTVVTADGEKSLEPCYVAVCERLGCDEYDGLIGSALGDQLT